ncbi:MAG: hypothetical protein ACK4FZ_02190 [Vogesella sp.]|uniref:hypothetical protein n=1 Tax=Vogesella sp. TaxID=1904252 RepID=UPI003918E428
MPPLLDLLLQPLQALWRKHRDTGNNPYPFIHPRDETGDEPFEDRICYQYGRNPPRFPRFRPTVSRNAAIRAAFVSRGHGLRSTRRLAPGSVCLLDDGQRLHLGDNAAATQRSEDQVGRNSSAGGNSSH